MLPGSPGDARGRGGGCMEAIWEVRREAFVEERREPVFAIGSCGAFAEFLGEDGTEFKSGAMIKRLSAQF